MKSITHDELINKIFSVYEKLDKEKCSSLFLSSLSSNRLDMRSGLSVFAIMQSFPNHKYIVSDKSCCRKDLFEKMSEEDKQFMVSTTPCAICSNLKKIDLELDLITESFNEVGGLISHALLDYYCYLEATNKLKPAIPTQEDFRIFSEILAILLQADEKETAKKSISSEIRKIKGFKSNAEQRKALLETLGYCSILETKEHKGLLTKYTNLAVAQRKTHSSDWNYPADFWIGRDGINKESLKFWFGEFKELEQFWK